MTELKNFINDWKVNALTESAVHISGLKFRHVKNGSDGQEKIEISNLPQWARNFIDKGNTVEQCEKIQAKLYNEFIDIYKQVIVPQKNILHQSTLYHTK